MFNGLNSTNLRYLCCLPTSSLTNYDDSLVALRQVQDVVSVLKNKQKVNYAAIKRHFPPYCYIHACSKGI